MTNNNYKAKYIITSLALLFFVFSYVFQVHALTKETYQMEKYQGKINSYKQESKDLEYKFLQNNSFFEIQNIAQEFNFKEVDKVSYIEVFGSEVVVK
jgi:hypothetical protein